MRKGLLAGVAAAAAGIAGTYAVPTPTRDFDDLYAGVDPATRDALAEFRGRHTPQVVDVHGVLWRYLRAGEGDETVLFLHGMGGAADIWWQQIEALASRFRVIAVTYPAVEPLEELAVGVEAVLHAEGVERAHVVGSSLGGYLAQYLVATRPGRVASAVFANTFPPNDILRAQTRRQGTVAPLLPEWLVMRTFARSVREVIVQAAGGSALVEAYLLEQAHGGMSKADFAARYRCVVDDFEAPDPAAAGIRVLLLESDNDPLVSPELRRQLRATYPEAEVVTFEGVGHFPYLNAPEAYTEALLRFLSAPA